MFQIRIHGRGGQGVVTAAELLSVAANAFGRHAQAFPSFGSERTGAPVVAFCRIDDRPIRLREPVLEPDAVIVQDSTLLRQIDVLGGLRPAGYLLVNTAATLDDLGLGGVVARLPPGHAVAVSATAIARTHVGRPVPNAALLGAFAALTELISIDSVAAAIATRFHGHLRDGNVTAARAAYEHVKGVRSGASAA
ncbi:MAG: 2-oxoacid:acceptor oxidoreductase family protein [Micromonosporaceae bacterium]|nr:2-oxoacid:acceptor oxidoreductase family protein [Micromonosporaceae bacterium]